MPHHSAALSAARALVTALLEIRPRRAAHSFGPELEGNGPVERAGTQDAMVYAGGGLLTALGDLPDLIITLCEVFDIYIQHISQKFPATTN